MSCSAPVFQALRDWAPFGRLMMFHHESNQNVCPPGLFFDLLYSPRNVAFLRFLKDGRKIQMNV